MTSTNFEENLLKTDTRGRVRVPREKREALLAEFEASAVSAAQFARLTGINYATFAGWVAKRRKQRRAQSGLEAADGGIGTPLTREPLRLFEAGARSEPRRRWRRGLRDRSARRGTSLCGVAVATASGRRTACAAFQNPALIMLSFSGSLKIFLAVEPCDLRKSFNGLYGLVRERLGEDPREGALFVFSNRRRTRLKILYWDGSGLWVLIKRLEKGTFAWPQASQASGVKLRLAPEALALLTDGVDLRGARLRPWYERE
jgi:transposase